MIIRLAHVEVTVADLARASDFYVGLLGFAEWDRRGDALYLRAAEEYDAWSLKLLERDGPGLVSIGFRVSAAEDLDELRALHDRLGLEHRALPAGFEPGHGEGLRVRRPEGYVIDYYHEVEEIALYDEDGLVVPVSRRPGVHRGPDPVALDHVNLRVAEMAETIGYFVDELDFRISEQALAEDGSVGAAWMSRSRASHDVAALPSPQPGCHHFAYILPDPSSLLRTADLLADSGHEDGLQFGPGRHGVANAMAMYFLDPDGNRIEFYTGDIFRDQDRAPITWAAEQLSPIPGGRFWWGGTPKEGFARASPFRPVEWPAGQRV